MSRRAMIAAAWTIVILFLCWLPSHVMPVPEGGHHIPHLDKFVHAGMFAVFGSLWTWAGRGKRDAGRVALVGLVLAVVTELGQGTSLVHRDPDVLDAMADLAGTALGIGFGLWMARWLPGRLSKPPAMASAGTGGR